VEKIRRLVATKAVHGVELFHKLKTCQLMRRRMPLVDLCVQQVLGMRGSVMRSKTILRDSLGGALTTMSNICNSSSICCSLNRVSATANQASVFSGQKGGRQREPWC
jgi:hypothetical protein